MNNMQNEFDKEIDALLRKAVTSDGVAIPSSVHLDADEISMFAENALAGGAKDRATAHMADCGRCRDILVSVVELNAEEGIDFAPVVAPSTQVVETSTATSFWTRLFSVRNLATAFGVLALAFGGFLGFTAWNASQGVTEITQGNKENIEEAVKKRESADKTTPETLAKDDNVDTLDLALDQETPKLSEGNANAGRDVAKPAERQNKRVDAGASRKEVTTSKEEFLLDKPSVAADESDNKAADLDTSPSEAEKPISESRNEVLTTRGATPKRKPTKIAPRAPAPVTQDKAERARASGTSAASEAKKLVRRTVSGKTFEKRAAGWYDINYKNQRPTVVVRGTTAYGNLDAGLRTIGNRLAGTVFVVWKSKAYKIQ